MEDKAKPRRPRSRCFAPRVYDIDHFCATWIGRMARKIEAAESAHAETCAECSNKDTKEDQTYKIVKNKELPGYA